MKNTKLKIALINAKKRQVVFADEVGISETYLSRIINLGFAPSPDLQERMAKALNLKVEDIF